VPAKPVWMRYPLSATSSASRFPASSAVCSSSSPKTMAKVYEVCASLWMVPSALK
jgi:hypothetical protein